MPTPLIHVSKPYLPDRTRLARYIDRIYDSYWLTNRGPLVRELEERLAEYLGVERLILTSNGTLALQIAYRSLGVEGAALTTPFSFVATAASLRWEGIEPVFVDIDPDTFNMDPSGIAAATTADVTAIVPVHVYGNPSDPDIDRYASDHDLRVVHDAAHAFGVDQGGRSVLTRGDASILSLHATKLFHTAEGGAIVFTDAAAHTEALSIMNFGITGEDTVGSLGFNAKMSEMSAAMGLAMLDEIDVIMELRRVADERYLERLGDAVRTPSRMAESTSNHAYRPVVFESAEETVAVRDALREAGVLARRYFRPSLDRLPYLKGPAMPLSNRAADIVLCLPLYAGLTVQEVDMIVDTALRALDEHRKAGLNKGAAR